jgi:oligopeptide/dipeptide ABC transporter ATP-binding protein
VFQDPFLSLNPWMRVHALISEAWKIHRSLVPREKWSSEVLRLLNVVGLDEGIATRRPAELSGGQRQRIAIARALAARPELLVCDEPVSALDVSVQAQVLNLLRRLQVDEGLSILFISHDMSVVQHLSHHVGVMYLGKLVEVGTVDEVLDQPRHPYTRALISATPTRPGASRLVRIVLQGDLPSPIDPPSGCHFRSRCWKAQSRCASEEPLLGEGAQHRFACHFPEGGMSPGPSTGRASPLPDAGA